MSPLTYADYAALPDDGHRYELIDGELVMTPAPGYAHQRVLARLVSILDSHVCAKNLGELLFAPLDVILSESTTVQPDIVFLAHDRERQVRKRGIEGPPSLVVELLSPNRLEHDLEVKRELYFRYGVPHYWIVDPEQRTLERLVLEADGYRRDAAFSRDDAAALRPFPDLVIALAKIWSPELPD